jgi:hypothetical protein
MEWRNRLRYSATRFNFYLSRRYTIWEGGPPAVGAGFVTRNSSPTISNGRVCTVPSKFGYVLPACEPTSYRSPWQNGHVERLIGSTRRECTDHTIVFNDEHLRRILSKYASYYNEVRTHHSLRKDAPLSVPKIRFCSIGDEGQGQAVM